MSDEKVNVSKSYLNELKKKVNDLKILTKISTIISSTLEFKDLMVIVMQKAKEIMSAEACSILLYNKEKNKLEFEVALCSEKQTSDILKKKVELSLDQGIAGWVAKHQEYLVIDDVRRDKRFFQGADKITGFVTKSLIAAPLVGRSGLIGVAEIINPKRKDFDLEILKLLTKQFAIAIENALYHKESIEREKLKQELEIASTIQKSFLPDSPIYKKDNLHISAINIPAKHVGGDLYDFIEPFENHTGILIGDVSGKGVSAALFMAKIISEFRLLASSLITPDIVLNKLNSLLSKVPRGIFLTSIYMILDRVSGEVKVSNAGHPPLILVRGRGVKVLDLDSGPPLGIVSQDYTCTTLNLKRGDRLIMLTDGVFEAKNKYGKRIGFKNIVNFVRNNTNKTDMTNEIYDFVSRHSKGVMMSDDLTIVCLTYIS